MLEDYSQLESEQRSSLSDRLEWLVDGMLFRAALLFSPWRWFRAKSSAEHGAYYSRVRGPSVRNRVQRLFVLTADSLAGSVSWSLDWLELTTANLGRRVRDLASIRNSSANQVAADEDED